MSHPLCRECGGEGQVGMYRDGSPMVCRSCGGSGLRASDLESRVDAASDWARDEAALGS